MITHTFLNKCNTIIEDSENNTGLNPVAELNVGDTLTRIILNFDLTQLRKQVESGEVNVDNLSHKLKMTNCGSINLPMFNDVSFVSCKQKVRASSFDIIAFKLPCAWDEGRGFDYNADYTYDSHKIVSTDGSNWFRARNYTDWPENGIYSYETLSKDYYENFNINDNAIVISRQHFDNGTENLDLDLTNYINKVLLNNEEFYGIGLAFSPRFENETIDNKFISFFTNHTNTFFAPYLETINNNTVLDDRANFHIGVNNKLYFFVSDNGNYINLDVLPTCKINDVDYEVKHGGKGVYYIELCIKNGDVEPNTILFDTWSNIIINGETLDDVEMEFVVLPIENRVSIGRVSVNAAGYTPELSGINHKENVKIGDIREVLVDFIEDYSYGKKIIPSESEYRIYVKENDREINIYPYQNIERRYDEHMFVIDTNELIPNDYHIDIRTKKGRNVKVFENILEFKVVSNVTNFYK
jgi:hypothetical protein